MITKVGIITVQEGAIVATGGATVIIVEVVEEAVDLVVEIVILEVGVAVILGGEVAGEAAEEGAGSPWPISLNQLYRTLRCKMTQFSVSSIRL